MEFKIDFSKIDCSYDPETRIYTQLKGSCRVRNGFTDPDGNKYEHNMMCTREWTIPYDVFAEYILPILKMCKVEEFDKVDKYFKNMDFITKEEYEETEKRCKGDEENA